MWNNNIKAQDSKWRKEEAFGPWSTGFGYTTTYIGNQDGQIPRGFGSRNLDGDICSKSWYRRGPRFDLMLKKRRRMGSRGSPKSWCKNDGGGNRSHGRASVRPNPPPLGVRGPSNGFGLTSLRGISLVCGWVLGWLKCPIPCFVRTCPCGHPPFPFNSGHTLFPWVFKLINRLACWLHGAMLNPLCDFMV